MFLQSDAPEPIIYGVDGTAIEYVMEADRLLSDRFENEYQISNYRITMYGGEMLTIYFDHVDLMHRDLRHAPFYQIAFECKNGNRPRCEIISISGYDSE